MREDQGANGRSSEGAAGRLTTRIRQVGDQMQSRPNEASLEEQSSEVMRDQRLRARLKRTPVERGRHEVKPPFAVSSPTEWIMAAARRPTDADTLPDDEIDRAGVGEDAMPSELSPQVIKWQSRVRCHRQLSALCHGASWLVSIVVTAASIGGAARMLLP